MKPILAAVILCLVSATLAEHTSANTVSVYTESSPPYHFLDESGRVAGSSTAKVKSILARAGLSAEFNLVPWARAVQSVDRQPNALIYSIAKTAQREHMFHWIAPVSMFKLAFVALDERSDIVIPDWSHLAQLSIAVQRDDIAHHWLNSLGLKEGVHFIACADIQCSWQRLQRGNVDLIIEDPALIPMMQKRLGLAELKLRKVAYIPELEVTGYLAANKAMDASYLERIKQALAAMHANYDLAQSTAPKR